MKIIGICGSNRKGSYNMTLLRYLETMSRVDFEIIDISKLPMFSEDIEHPTPEEVKIFKQKLKNADGFVISTPEHNYSVPALLKNALDWASRGEEKVLDNKYVSIISASMGMFGGSRVQYHLRQICVCLNLKPLNRPEVFISKAHEKIIDGNINDEFSKKLLNDVLNNLINEIKKEELI